MIQFIKFASVGALNTAIDFIVLNVLVFLFGAGSNGARFALFKGISFVAAVLNSYIFNKYWVFKKKEKAETKEPVLFLLISTLGMFLNVAISHGVFQSVSQLENIPMYIAVNISALMGSIFVLIFNFLGYKFLVFKKPEHV